MPGKKRYEVKLTDGTSHRVWATSPSDAKYQVLRVYQSVGRPHSGDDPETARKRKDTARTRVESVSKE
jgi:hypothetical protein